MIVGGETWPKLLQEKATKYDRKKIALRHKEFGVWKEYTWKDYYDRVKEVSLGLIGLGLKPRDKVMILGYNDPHFYWAILGVVAGQGVATCFPPDATPEETKYILQQSDSTFAIVQDQEQVEKLLEIKGDLNKLAKIIYWNPKGMVDYQDPLLLSFQPLLQKGKEFETNHPGFFEQLIGQSREEDIALLLYTSGVKGDPKGVLLTHKAGISSARKSISSASLKEDFEIFSHLPIAWFSAFTLELGVHLVHGLTVNFPEGPETVLADLREIGPHFVMFTPRQWESLVRQIQIRVGNAGLLKRLCYRLFLPIGYERFEKGGQVNLFSKFLFFMGSGLLFRPLKDKLGLLRVKSAITGGASISPESFRFLNALGINLKQTYGLVEMNPISWQEAGDLKGESVGKGVADTEIKISEEGEILAKGDQMLQGYYKNPGATRATLRDGWVYTGDAGTLDKDGNLLCWGRLADMISLPKGEKFSPPSVEDKLRFNMYIKDVVVVWENSLMALIQLDFETVSKWAERNNIPYMTFSDLSQKSQVYELIGQAIQEVNQTLPEEAKVARYFLLNKPFSADESELTRSGKLRRDFIIEKYCLCVTKDNRISYKENLGGQE